MSTLLARANAYYSQHVFGSQIAEIGNEYVERAGARMYPVRYTKRTVGPFTQMAEEYPQFALSWDNMIFDTAPYLLRYAAGERMSTIPPPVADVNAHFAQITSNINGEPANCSVAAIGSANIVNGRVCFPVRFGANPAEAVPSSMHTDHPTAVAAGWDNYIGVSGACYWIKYHGCNQPRLQSNVVRTT